MPCVFILTPQLETVTIEVSTLLVLRANTQQLHRAIHLPSMGWTYSDTGFYGGQTSYLNMKALTFAKDSILKALLT